MGKEQAERRYAEIAEAYTVLSDAEKRRIYDAGGEEALKRQEGGGGGGGGGPINNIQDLFKRFAGGGGGGGAQKEAKEGPVMTALVDTDVRELYTGAFLDVVLAHRAQCPKCSGTGSPSFFLFSLWLCLLFPFAPSSPFFHSFFLHLLLPLLLLLLLLLFLNLLLLLVFLSVRCAWGGEEQVREVQRVGVYDGAEATDGIRIRAAASNVRQVPRNGKGGGE
jgi:hypothetical protein